jgi:hypothetical protein
MTELQAKTKAVYRVGVYSMSAGRGHGKVFTESDEAVEHFKELAEKHLNAEIRAEWITEWLPVAEA